MSSEVGDGVRVAGAFGESAFDKAVHVGKVFVEYAFGSVLVEFGRVEAESVVDDECAERVEFGRE